MKGMDYPVSLQRISYISYNREQRPITFLLLFILASLVWDGNRSDLVWDPTHSQSI